MCDLGEYRNGTPGLKSFSTDIVHRGHTLEQVMPGGLSPGEWALPFEDPDVIPKLGQDRSRPDPEAIPSEPRTGSGSSRDLVS